MERSRQKSLDLSIQWLLKSIDPQTGGSRANYSLIFNGLHGWSGPYPETTGYIIPTFLKAATDYRYSELDQRARTMAEWLLTLQFDDGAFPGNIYYPGITLEKSIFNTGQIILGMTAIYDQTNDKRFLTSADRAAQWLASNQAQDGSWQKFNYVKSFSPSYYSRVSWPILKVYARTGNEVLKQCALCNLESIHARQLTNGFIDGAGFKPGSYAFLHTVAYTIRGFLESSLILNDDTLWNVGYVFAEKLMHQFELRKRLYGAYYPDFKGIKWYQCLTGNAQISIIWLKIFFKTGDPRFLNAAHKAIDTVVARQVKSSINPNLIGGIAGSSPVFGRYMAMRYPNWAVKFFADALMLEHEASKKLTSN